MPQWSILGPQLFSIYINDLLSVYNDVDLITYADDTVLYTHKKYSIEVAMQLTKEMQKVVEWLNNSCLTLNVEQSVTMFFTNRSKLRDCPDILVNVQKIKNMDDFIYLVVTLDQTLE